MAERRPSFPFYPKDWLASTRGLSGAARGYHIDMLALSWLNGGCDTNLETLRRSVGAEKAEWRRVWPELATRWQEVDGRLINLRLERTREEANAYTEAKRLAGQKGGKAKAHAKHTPSTPLAEPVAETYPSSALPSPSPKTTTVAGAPVVVARVTPFDDELGAMPTRRRNGSMAWEAEREGLSVPDSLHAELLSRMATPDEPALLAWYAETVRAWRGRPVGEQCWKFWNKRFAEWQGATPTAPTQVAGLRGGGVAPRADGLSSCDHEPRCTSHAECRLRAMNRVTCPACAGRRYDEAGVACVTCEAAGSVRIELVKESA